MNFLLVFIDAGLGGALRHGVNLAAANIIGIAPLGTLFINCTGILGGFSTFSLETALLWERGETLAAIACASTSVVLSIGVLFGGLWLIRTLVARGVL